MPFPSAIIKRFAFEVYIRSSRPYAMIIDIDETPSFSMQCQAGAIGFAPVPLFQLSTSSYAALFNFLQSMMI